MPPSRSARAHERGSSLLFATLSWALALVGLACLAITAWALAVGARPLVIRTGSMAPAMPVGTLAVVRPEPATDVRVGDVVAVEHNDGERLMHRVRHIRAVGGGSVTLVTRGDHNRAADPPITVSRVERPLLVVPAVGRPLTWLRGPWVQYWLGVVTGVLGLLWIAVRRRREAEQPDAERRRPRRPSSRGPLRT
ncbi:MAG TPA: signal peptidase I [Conexibacter sp.]|nr:signal peptidase I [Conexibacter sp.]